MQIGCREAKGVLHPRRGRVQCFVARGKRVSRVCILHVGGVGEVGVRVVSWEQC
ncbi:hypothetical protein AG1IA_07336 [Rhizoctonia solani AG-1 IA]|uniref:Uncharacterized protein n=1 Tax=Thanatephorus cucumeris (strain AG1-IA) TaxID=983506 RepID=L8WQL3_THACA|nr:hypothetical protein AG1IA_07336 [Rhizoctonia solani AG-1 IA]